MTVTVMRFVPGLALVLLFSIGSFQQACYAAEPAELAAKLKSADAAEQHAAADALADLGPKAAAALPQLVAAMESKDAELRWRSARALGVIDDPRWKPCGSTPRTARPWCVPRPSLPWAGWKRKTRIRSPRSSPA
jgi:hypothetical protein